MLGTRSVFSDYTGHLSFLNCGTERRKMPCVHGGGHVQDSHLFDRSCRSHSVAMQILLLRAPLKTHLLRFSRIFAPNFSFCKVRNTQSIPNFTNLNLGTNLSPKSSKKSFQWMPAIFAAVLPRKGNHRKKGGVLPDIRDNKNCGNSRRNCRSRFSASKTTAVRTCRPRCGSHRLSSSPDLRFLGFAWPSQGNPNDRLSPNSRTSTHTVAVPFVICTRFSILPWGCYHTHRHSNGYSLANRIALWPRFVNRKRDCDFRHSVVRYIKGESLLYCF